MLGRAGDLTARARERIRAAREHDPHAWPLGNEDSAALMHELEAEALAEARAPTSRRTRRAGRALRHRRRGPPPLGSPEPGAPDLDGAVSPGGVSGPPPEGRPHRPGDAPAG